MISTFSAEPLASRWIWSRSITPLNHLPSNTASIRCSRWRSIARPSLLSNARIGGAESACSMVLRRSAQKSGACSSSIHPICSNASWIAVPKRRPCGDTLLADFPFSPLGLRRERFVTAPPNRICGAFSGAPISSIPSAQFGLPVSKIPFSTPSISSDVISQFERLALPSSADAAGVSRNT